MSITKEWLLRRIEHCEKHLSNYGEEMNLTQYGYKSWGYWEGKRSSYEAVLSKLEEEDK